MIPAHHSSNSRADVDGHGRDQGPNQEPKQGPEKQRQKKVLRVVPGAENQRWLALFRRELTTVNLVSFLLMTGYIYLFCQSVSPYWFHPGWTSDDALQQVYPFHKVHHPELFRGDLITKMMECYLAPVHYWISYAITWLVGDPIMMSHWVMLLQVVLSAGFLFLAINAAAGFAPACLGVMWLFHTRYVMQRLTAGLPRGWAAPLFGAFLYFVFTKRHTAVLLTIGIGCLLHPPATLLIAAAYGMWLLGSWCVPRCRAEVQRPLLIFVLLSPLFAVLTVSVTRMPEEIGTMASFEVASQMPEFQDPGGRFPFVPLKPAVQELSSFGFQAFIGRFFRPSPFWREWIRPVVLLAIGGLLVGALWRRRAVVPGIVWYFLIAAGGVYAASRVLAFRLYVPNRHIQFPFAFFFIVFFAVGLWRLFHRGTTDERGSATAAPVNQYRDSRLRVAWPSVLAVFLLGMVVYQGSGSGLYGTANFNYSSTKRGGVFNWIKEHTPPDAIIAGDPTFIDPVQLFGMRQAFVTTETAHPFYDRYNIEMRRRLEISIRANYAPDLKALVALAVPEGIDYFVFERKQFRSENLAKAKYFIPWNGLVKDLTAGPADAYAFRSLPATVDLVRAPYMPYRDAVAAVVDINVLRQFIAEHDARNEIR